MNDYMALIKNVNRAKENDDDDEAKEISMSQYPHIDFVF